MKEEAPHTCGSKLIYKVDSQSYEEWKVEVNLPHAEFPQLNPLAPAVTALRKAKPTKAVDSPFCMIAIPSLKTSETSAR